MNDVAAPAFGIGHNLPPVIDQARERVAALESAANDWAKACAVIEDAETAAQCTDFLDQLLAEHKKWDAQRAAEKKPHDEAAKAVQERWKPLLDKLLLCKGAIEPRHRAWLQRERQRLEAERRQREAEAREAAREAERAQEAARRAVEESKGDVVQSMLAANAAVDAAADASRAAAAVPRRAQVRGALGGRARSLRETWSAHIVDPDLFYQHVKDRPEVKDVLQRLANAAARGGIRNPDLPGCWVYSSEEA